MLPAPWNPDQVNPALMTLKEYQSYCNENDKWHPDSAYDFDLSQTHNEFQNKADFKKIRTFKANGISFDLMYKTEKKEYAQRNPHDDGMNPWLRVNGQIVYYTDEEVKRLGYQPFGFEFAIFEGDKRVAMAQDEWGCVLIAVAKEYRGFGLGTIIGKIARTYEPGKTSGGFTPMGSRNFARLHREFVRDALTSNLYSNMVRGGQISMERVKEIVTSAKVQMRPVKDDVDLNSNSPDNWLLFADHYGSFILYDKKLATVIDNERYDHTFAERMIKGYVYAMPHESAGITRIKQFGGDAPGIKAFMLALAYTRAVIDKLPLWVEPEEYDLTGFKYGEEENTVGYKSKEVLDGKVINYISMVEEEKRFRKRFDEHDEFKHRLQEMAQSKYEVQPVQQVDRYGYPTRRYS
jgi:GNAT superfamily N-acetyltransferase